MKHFFSILIMLFVTSIGFHSYGQGCSDAGVCSTGSLGLVQIKLEKLPSEEFKLVTVEVEDTEVFSIDFDPSKSTFDRENDSDIVTLSSSSNPSQKSKTQSNFYGQPKFILGYNTIYGRGDNKTNILTYQLEATYFLFKNKLSAQIKLPYQTVSGDLGKTSGLGDITASLSYSIINSHKNGFSVVGGIKLPVNNSNISNNNQPLPMVYQTSLGTTDALFGFNYRYKSWDITAAYQHPFNSNKNQYLKDTTQNVTYNNYFESKNLKRADDAVLRLNKRFNFNKFSFSSGLLFIYHVDNDQFETMGGSLTSSKGSKGLTLNLNISSIITITKNLDFVFIYASPVVTRDSRPAGLARKFIFMGGIQLKTF